MVVGPAAGGVLAERPVTGLFRRYPYSLPNIFAASLALLALCIIEAWLPGKSSYARVADTDEDKDEAPAPRRACARVPRTSWLPIGVYCFLSTSASSTRIAPVVLLRGAKAAWAMLWMGRRAIGEAVLR